MSSLYENEDNWLASKNESGAPDPTLIVTHICLEEGDAEYLVMKYPEEFGRKFYLKRLMDE